MTEDLLTCKHEKRSLIQGSRFSGDSGSGRDDVLICLDCGKLLVFAERDGKYFEIEFRIMLYSQLEAIERSVAFFNEDETRTEKIEAAIQYITDWRDKAYPLDIFPEIDSARAHEVLKSAGMTIDAVSASMGRHVLTRVCEILKEKGLLHEQEDH